MTMFEVRKRSRVRRSPVRGVFVVGGLVLATMLIVAACGGDDDGEQADPAGVLANYEDTRNTGDVDALMLLYTDDAVVTDHPLDTDDTATGVDEIRPLEGVVPSIRRSENATEYINVESSGNTVTFDMNFHMASGECLGSTGHEVTVDGDKIASFDWGSVDEPCQ